jgi:hypothetical protein
MDTAALVERLNRMVKAEGVLIAAETADALVALTVERDELWAYVDAMEDINISMDAHKPIQFREYLKHGNSALHNSDATTGSDAAASLQNTACPVCHGPAHPASTICPNSDQAGALSTDAGGHDCSGPS